MYRRAELNFLKTLRIVTIPLRETVRFTHIEFYRQINPFKLHDQLGKILQTYRFVCTEIYRVTLRIFLK